MEQSVDFIKIEHEQQLVGKVVKQVYYDPNTHFTIFRMRIIEAETNPAMDLHVSAKGTLREVHAGEQFRLRGRWLCDERYGWTFMFQHFEKELPADDEDMIDYLTSFKLDKRIARKIVKEFGGDTPRIIRENPDAIRDILPEKQANKFDQFLEVYEEIHRHDEAIAILRPFVPVKKILSIIKHYGEETLTVIKQSPYKLCEEVDGIGFTTADHIAAEMGVAPNDQARLQAAVWYVCQEAAASFGHVYLPLFDLQRYVVTLLQRTGRAVEQSEVAVAITDLIRSEKMKQDGEAIYLPYFWSIETRLARKLKGLINHEPLLDFSMDLIDEAEKHLGIQYAGEQKQAFSALSKSNVLVITGGPGTGKSTILKGLLYLLKKAYPQYDVALAAPTGKAAQRMTEITGYAASTIHRLLGCRPNDKGELEPQFNDDSQLYHKVVVVDEVSMVDVVLMYWLVRALQPGTVLVLIGDSDQLPSVGPGSVLHDLVQSGTIPVVRLSHIFRQADTSRIIVNAALINRGVYKDLEWGWDFLFFPANNPAETAQMVVQTYRKCLQEGLTMNDIQILSPFRRNTETGSRALNGRLQQEFNPPEEKKGEMKFGQRVYREGDPVMQIRNNYDKGVFNGSTGRIVLATDREVEIFFDDLGDRLVFSREEMDEVELN